MAWPISLWHIQPLKGAYILFRVTSLLVLLPYWVLSYSIPSLRPRASWTLKGSIMVRIIRWMMPLNAKCNISPLRTDKTRQVPDNELKETRFTWIGPADKTLVTGPAEDEKVKPARIPGYVWPKDGEWETYQGLVGLFFHGGGYMMGNGLESFGELGIVRELHKTSDIRMVLSVDYRLSGEACHPGQLLDAIAAYAYLTNNIKVDPSRIIIIGACAGGHLALMLARYLRDTKVLPMPAGIMLFSPWVDLVIDREIEKGKVPPRPNTDIDLLSTSFLANLRFLGHHPQELLSSPLLSGNLAPAGSYSNYPRTFISVGECEAWRRENEELRDRMVQDGVDCNFDVQDDAVHDFWGFGDIVPTARARAQVANNAVQWIRGLAEV